MTSITDATGKVLEFTEPPRRVVSLIPSITESLFELGAGQAVAGISNYCIYPGSEVKNRTKVGGQKNPNFKKIAQINPDLIILNMEENKPEHIEALSEHYRTYVTYPRKLADTEQLLSDLGMIFQVETKAAHYAAAVRDQIQALASKSYETYKTMYLIWRDPWMSLNQDTFIHDVLHRHGLQNVFAERPERYCDVTEEDILAADPDVIILPDEPYHFLEKHKAEFTHLDVSAVRNNRIFLADGTYFCWYGTRTARAFGYIRDLISDTRLIA
jgi:ABC-type Fe3+-hydroxamate transport system substrate-binding protein